MWIIVHHYSNENIGEFSNITIFEEGYKTLEDATAAANAKYEEDLRNGVDHGETLSSTVSDAHDVFYTTPAYVVGEHDEEYFAAYHNIYAVFHVALGKEENKQ